MFIGNFLGKENFSRGRVSWSKFVGECPGWIYLGMFVGKFLRKGDIHGG